MKRPARKGSAAAPSKRPQSRHSAIRRAACGVGLHHASCPRIARRTPGQLRDQLVRPACHCLMSPDPDRDAGHGLGQIGDHMPPAPGLGDQPFAKSAIRQHAAVAQTPPDDRGPKCIIASDRDAKCNPVPLEPCRETGNTRPRPIVKPGLGQQSAHRAEHVFFADEKQGGAVVSRFARLQPDTFLRAPGFSQQGCVIRAVEPIEKTRAQPLWPPIAQARAL